MQRVYLRKVSIESVSGLIELYYSAAFVKQVKRVPSGLYRSMFFSGNARISTYFLICS